MIIPDLAGMRNRYRSRSMSLPRYSALLELEPNAVPAVGGTGVGKFEINSVTRWDALLLPPAVEDSDFRYGLAMSPSGQSDPVSQSCTWMDEIADLPLIRPLL